jgi:hypothetical protein
LGEFRARIFFLAVKNFAPTQKDDAQKGEIMLNLVTLTQMGAGASS